MENHLIDIIFGLGSVISDSTSTYFGVKRRGIEIETNLKVKKSMENNGIGKGLIKINVKDISKITAIGSLTYLLDKMLGIENNLINYHHILIYGIGGLKYYATITNTLYNIGLVNLADLIKKPLSWLLKD